MNRAVIRCVFLAAAPVTCALGLLAACGDEDADGVVVGPDTGVVLEGSTKDSPGFDSSIDQRAPVDGGTDSSLTATVLAKFDPIQGELAEGVTVFREDGGPSTPIVGFAPQGRIVSISPDGGSATFASFAGAAGSYTLGMTVDTAGNVYVAVADVSGGAGSTPAAGVYRILASDATRTPTQFTVAAGVTFSFLNGLDLFGNDLFITDSTGTIFIADGTTGVTKEWLSANGGPPELAGDMNDCKLGNPFPIGINGIAHDANNIYVVNTDKGSLLRIPRLADAGVGGAIVTIKKDPSLCGADGLVIDKDGSFLIANNPKNKVQRVTPAGVITTVYEGAPLDGPASLWIDTQGATRRLLVTNSAFGSSATDGGKPAPSLISLPLAP